LGGNAEKKTVSKKRPETGENGGPPDKGDPPGGYDFKRRGSLRCVKGAAR